jgi:cob(I)alamin adenosyltransferase
VSVYTRKGDDGTTGLADGRRVQKDASRVDAYGEVDELSAVLGVLRAEPLPEPADAHLERVQRVLFEVGAALADPRGRTPVGADVSAPGWLEGWIDGMDAGLPPLRNFILPAGSRPASLAHQARAVCRRAERRVVALAGEDARAMQVVPVLNRLSDALFVLARWLNQQAGHADATWRAQG